MFGLGRHKTRSGAIAEITSITQGDEFSRHGHIGLVPWRWTEDGRTTLSQDRVYAEDIITKITEPCSEGRKDDKDKYRLDLIPPELMFALGDILSSGAKKYNARNWEAGMAWGRVFGALMRHMWAWWGGKGPTTISFLFGDLDDETGRSHLWHAACCIAFLIAYEERQIGEDDRHKGAAK